MNGAVIVGLVALALTAMLGTALAVRAPEWRPAPWLVSARRRAGVVVDTSVHQVGRVTTALVVLLAGGGLAIAVLWPLGWPIKLAERAVDVPVFHWWQERYDSSWGWWRHAWTTLTNIGGLTQTQTLTLVFAVVLAVLWRRRRWWVPLTVLPTAYVMEKTLQDLLKLVVDRGHPPTTLGSFPSGGCARVILIYGLIVFFLLRWRGTTNPRTWVAGGAVVAMCAVVQAYARTFNLEHWITDVFAGVIFGLLLLATAVSAVLVLDRDATAPAVERPRQRDEVAVG